MDVSIGKLKLSRAEIIFCGALLLGGVGFGVYRLDQAAYKAREPEVFEENTQTVAPGETLALTYREIGREVQGNSIPWNGTVEMTLTKAVLYPSYADAHAVEENVKEPNGLLNDSTKDVPFLVVEVSVTNIDAEEGDYQWRQAAVTGISGTDGAITLQDQFNLYADTPLDGGNKYLASALWCVDGVASSNYGNFAEVPQGETVQVTLGFPLENGAEEHLDGAALIYCSIFDRMAVGSPTLGGEKDAALP